MKKSDSKRYFEQVQMEHCKEKQKLCAGCAGDCKQELQFFMPCYEVTVQGVIFSQRQCKYYETWKQQQRIRNLFKNSHIPAEFMDCGLEGFEITRGNQEAVKLTKWLIGQDEAGALYHGMCGVGKTRLAAVIAIEKIKQGKPVLFASVPDLLADLKASFRADSTTRTDEILETIKKTPCLILDDLGSERITEWVAENLFMIINYRLGEGLQTIITSNYDKNALVTRMSYVDKQGYRDLFQGKRIVSRISRLCKYTVKLTGEDYRMRE